MTALKAPAVVTTVTTTLRLTVYSLGKDWAGSDRLCLPAADLLLPMSLHHCTMPDSAWHVPGLSETTEPLRPGQHS